MARKKKHSFGTRLLLILLLYIPLGYVALSLSLVLLMKSVPVCVTPLMAVRMVQHSSDESFHTNKKWVPIEEISVNMSRAVIAAEDQRFYTHHGFDYVELDKMHRDHVAKGKPVRGCSTISQQTAKNCFTFCTRSWIRKIFEAYYTVLIEKFWGKERIMEVYLNVAEMGVGIYGVEAACEEYYGHGASRMSEVEAASLACCLPNPAKRTPQWVDKHMAGRRTKLIHSMRML